MKNKATPLLDEHLQSLEGMRETETDAFFYTRLRARMEKNGTAKGWNLPLRPVWVIGALLLLLGANGYMLSQQAGPKNASAANAATIQSFAESYDQSITSTY